MPTTALNVFDTTLEKTNVWLNEICDELDWDQKHGAYTALRATLHALRDRLPVNEAAQLGAQLPMLIRGFYYEGWHPANKPVKVRHRDEFLEQIAQECRTSLDAPIDEVVRAVFQVLERHVTPGEITSVIRALPDELRELWP